MTIQCQDALPLVPAYLDGELSEAQAGPLRKHLLSCHPCRSSVQDGKSLKRWFAAAVGEPVVVPTGFAARVARRAMAGDTGEHTVSAPRRDSAPERELTISANAPQREGRLLQFVLVLTAVAAAALLALAVALRHEGLPGTSRLEADETTKPVEMIMQELDRINVRDSGVQVRPISNDPAEPAGAFRPRDTVPTQPRKP